MAPSGRFCTAVPTDRAGAAPGRPSRRCESGVHGAHGHALGNVVQRHRRRQHGCAGQLSSAALGLFAEHVKVRNRMIQRQEKENSQLKNDRGGHKGPVPPRGAPLHGRNEQTPHRRGRHHACGKSLHSAGKASIQSVFYKIDRGRPPAVPAKGIKNSTGVSALTKFTPINDAVFKGRHIVSPGRKNHHRSSVVQTPPPRHRARLFCKDAHAVRVFPAKPRKEESAARHFPPQRRACSATPTATSPHRPPPKGAPRPEKPRTAEAPRKTVQIPEDGD